MLQLCVPQDSLRNSHYQHRDVVVQVSATKVRYRLDHCLLYFEGALTTVFREYPDKSLLAKLVVGRILGLAHSVGEKHQPVSCAQWSFLLPICAVGKHAE